MRVLVLADDLTGAGDTVVSFARSGWSSLLSLSGGWRHEPEEEAVAVTLDSRRDPRAEQLTARSAGDLHPELLYVKIDSTVRGRVAEQVRGAVAGRRRSRPGAYAVLCPAYPAMGRTVEGGHVIVHGVPVHESAAGDDAVTPVTESDLCAVVSGAVLAAGEDLAAAIREASLRSDVVVVDARDQTDLDRLAAAVAEIGPDAIPVGSAGLAVALARVWRMTTQSAPRRVDMPEGSRSLVVVSSLHPVARQQVAELGAQADRLAVDLLVTDPERVDGAAEQRARTIGADAATALAGQKHGLLVLVGGDGAAQTLLALGATGIRVLDAPVEGVPLGTLVGGPYDGLPVATKAGGFGDAHTLTQLIGVVHGAQGAPS